MVKLIFPKRYEKMVEKFLKKHPELLSRYIKTLELLKLNPFHPSLRLHKLQGCAHYSVSINMQYRITMGFYIEGDVITLIRVGGHEEVY